MAGLSAGAEARGFGGHQTWSRRESSRTVTPSGTSTTLAGGAAAACCELEDVDGFSGAASAAAVFPAAPFFAQNSSKSSFFLLSILPLRCRVAPPQASSPLPSSSRPLAKVRLEILKAEPHTCQLTLVSATAVCPIRADATEGPHPSRRLAAARIGLRCALARRLGRLYQEKIRKLQARSFLPPTRCGNRPSELWGATPRLGRVERTF